MQAYAILFAIFFIGKSTLYRKIKTLCHFLTRMFIVCLTYVYRMFNVFIPYSESYLTSII